MSDGLTDGTRLVVRAGSPTPEELVAVLLALDAASAADGASAAAPVRRPAWVDAARREGVGGAPAATRTNLRGWA